MKIRHATNEFPFCSHVAVKDKNNLIGFEFNCSQIRVDGVRVKDFNSFSKLMDVLVALARRDGYTRIFFGDSLYDELLVMFLRYGFLEKIVDTDRWNHYLYLEV